jgi:hypothetical protein
MNQPPPFNPYEPPAANPYGPPAFGPQPGGYGGTAPGATASLVLGILSIFCCGFILGPLAIVYSNKAKAAIFANPGYTGAGMATAGMVLGICGLVLHVIGLILRLTVLSTSSSPF